MNDIILIHLYVSSMDDYAQLNAVYKKHFDVNPPARWGRIKRRTPVVC